MPLQMPAWHNFLSMCNYILLKCKIGSEHYWPVMGPINGEVGVSVQLSFL